MSIVLIIIEIKIFNYFNKSREQGTQVRALAHFFEDWNLLKNIIKFSANVNIYFYIITFLFNFGLSIITSLYYLFK